MWSPTTRGRMAEIEKKTKRYPTDLTDEEWLRIEPFLPGPAKSGRPVETDLREVLNAIRYLARSGGGWPMLPKDFPPWPTVYWWFRRFVRRFLFQTIHDVALMRPHQAHGQGRLPRLHHRNHQTVRYRAGLRSPSTPLGRRAHLRMDDPWRRLVRD